MDDNGDIIYVFAQDRRNGTAAKRFFRRLFNKNTEQPQSMITDKLRVYGLEHRELSRDITHDTSKYANNRAELSHQPTRTKERGMRRFKSTTQTQRFLSAHTAVHNLFNLGRHLLPADSYRSLRLSAFRSWRDTILT